MGALDGKVAIVTGAGRGIGRGHARLLAAEGAKVVVNDLGGAVAGEGADLTPAQEVVNEIVAAGGEAVVNGDDVASWDGAQALVQQAIDTFGGLHVLVNNAGILRDKMSFNMDESDWDAVIRVHLKGHFAPTRFAAAYWRDRSKAGEPTSGRIINTSSESGLFGNAGQTNYDAAKAGIASLTLALARELHRYGVTVNAIAPRARTRMTDNIFQWGSSTEKFDYYDPENVAPTVAWLASDDAADVTGRIFIVGGGDVFLVQNFTPTNHLQKDGRWSVAEISANKAKLFAGESMGLPAQPTMPET
ncbi:MAG TPA: SDR family oxidoreductase [Acidimicrobiia bacterium]|nr:SDR family oxidoreductase [Acidimicrobiia bacterium]